MLVALTSSGGSFSGLVFVSPLGASTVDWTTHGRSELLYTVVRFQVYSSTSYRREVI
jgi:hypothetical protein